MSTTQKALTRMWHPLGALNKSTCSDLWTVGNDLFTGSPPKDAAVSSQLLNNRKEEDAS